MWERIGKWLGRSGAGGAAAIVRPRGLRVRSAKPAYDRGLRRALQDWPGAGETPGREAPRLAACRTWSYQLQGINWERLEATIADMAVIDVSADGNEDNVFSPGQIERMRTKPGSADPTTLLCYLSVGAAESWRYYWNPKWQRARPAWMEPTPSEWSGTALVRYFDPRWRAILYEKPGSMLDRILSLGFDGVVLDGIETYEHFRAAGRSNAPDEMVELVAAIGARAWQVNPNFLVIPINGEELLGSPRYRSVISGIIREDILYRPDFSTGQPREIENNERIVAAIMSDLRLAKADGIPVLAMEYLRGTPDDEARIPLATQRLRGMSLIPAFAPRNLDRLTPPAY
jgi:cysteinyl-tRNA synthetase